MIFSGFGLKAQSHSKRQNDEEEEEKDEEEEEESRNFYRLCLARTPALICIVVEIMKNIYQLITRGNLSGM